MPGMNAAGMNTAGENQSDPDHRAGQSRPSALNRRFLRRKALGDVTFHRLDDDDRIVDNKTDRQHQAEQRERVDRKAEHRKEQKRPNQRDGNGQQGNQCGSPALQEHVHHQNDQDDGDQQRFDDLFHALGDGARGIDRDRVVDVVAGNGFLASRDQSFFTAAAVLDRIRPGQLVERQSPRSGFPSKPPGDAVVLRAQLHSGHIFAGARCLCREFHERPICSNLTGDD